MVNSQSTSNALAIDRVATMAMLNKHRANLRFEELDRLRCKLLFVLGSDVDGE
jgi:hypothetical protein